MCYLLILAVGLLMSDALELGGQALIELAGCLCGGALAGMLGGHEEKEAVRAAEKIARYSEETGEKDPQNT